MLYLWPFFAFFSAPLLIPPIVSLGFRLLGFGSQLFTTGTAKEVPSKTKQLDSVILQSLDIFFKIVLPVVFAVGGVVAAVGIVKYNTIIHPFTLADNRHYMFYIFRYTILRGTTVRYSLVAIYCGCAWAVWKRLAGHSSVRQDRTDTNICSPFPLGAEGQLDDKKSLAAPDSSLTSPATSTALFWLLTTALSLITAPLVEPRYLILPWIFWRLLVPSWPIQTYDLPEALSAKLSTIPLLGWLYKQGRHSDLTLWLETAWFLVVNLGTMYMFLFRPYVWRNEQGEVLDDGRLQRFMW
jgi:alpha-1,2-glucosyltransferase